MDLDMHQRIFSRLERIREHLPGDPVDVAEQMIRGSWERIKCSYGSMAFSTLPTIPLPVPGLARDLSFPVGLLGALRCPSIMSCP